MSVREIAKGMAEDREFISVAYKQLSDKADQMKMQFASLGSYIESSEKIGAIVPEAAQGVKKAKEKYQQMSDFFSRFQDLQKLVSNATQYADPFDILLDSFSDHRIVLNETKSSLTEIDTLYRNIFVDKPASMQEAPKLAIQPEQTASAPDAKPKTREKTKPETLPKKHNSSDELKTKFKEYVSGGNGDPASLSKLLGISPSMVSYLGATLVESKEIEKHPDVSDKRKVRYSIPQSVKFDYESFMSKIMDKGSDYNKLMLIGTSGIKVLMESQKTTDAVEISAATNIEKERVKNTLESFKISNIITDGKLSDYGNKLAVTYAGLAAPERIMFHLGKGPKDINKISSLTGFSASEVDDAIRKMGESVVSKEHGYGISPKILQKIDDLRDNSKNQHAAPMTIEKPVVIDNEKLITLTDLGKKIDDLTFPQKGVLQDYQEKSRKCNPKELKRLNEKFLLAMNGGITPKEYYVITAPLKEKKNEPGLWSQRR